jgi:hypothetical protein
MALDHRTTRQALGSTLLLFLGTVHGLGCDGTPAAETGGASTVQEGGGGTAGSGAGGSSASTGDPGGGATTTEGAGGTGGEPAGGAPGAGGGGAGTGGNDGGAGSGNGGSSGGAGGGGGDPEALCNEVCGPDACQGAVCTVGLGLSIGLLETPMFLPDGTTVNSTYAFACRRPPYSIVVEKVVTDGDCRYIKTSGGFPNPVPFDAGSITIGTVAVGTLTLPPADPGPCQTLQQPAENTFSAGDVITFDIGGGADVPAVSAAVIAPEDITLSVPPIQAGEPLFISWSPAPPPDGVTLIGPGPDFAAISCIPTLPGGVTVSATLTALLGSTAGNATVTAGRTSYFATDFGGAGVFTSMGVTTADTILDVPYSP